jgi:hypothetical protein
MWGTKTLARARRRLGMRRDGRPQPPVTAQPSTGEEASQAPAGGEMAVVLTRAEMDTLAATLELRLGAATPRLDSPARVQAALEALIAALGGLGRPLVVRSPAGLYTPEYWHIRIDDADTVTHAELGRLVGGRRVD